MRAKFSQKGLTIVELVVSMAISSIVMLGIVPLVLFFFSSFSSNLAELKLDNEINSASLSIERDILHSKAFLEKSIFGDSSTLNGVSHWSSDGYKGGGDDSRSLFLRMPSTTANKQNESRELVYNNLYGNCGKPNATPVYYETIYYVKDKKLYKRTVTPYPKDQKFCFDKKVYQANTCTTGTGSNCYGRDIEIMDNVSSFSIDYYDSPSSKTPISYSSDPQPVEVPATSVGIKIDASIKTSKGVIKQSVNLKKSIAW